MGRSDGALYGAAIGNSLEEEEEMRDE